MKQFAKPVLLKGMQIYAEDQLIQNGYLKLENQKIAQYGSIETLTSIEIISPPLSDSDLIVTSGNYGLADTAKVTITNISDR